jgi:hypothetical protein
VARTVKTMLPLAVSFQQYPQNNAAGQDDPDE